MTWHVQKKTKNVREEEVMEQEELPEDALKSKFNNLRNSKIEIISGLMFEEDEILINGRNYQVLENVKQKVMEYCMNLITFKKRQNRISHCINSGRHPLKIITIGGERSPHGSDAMATMSNFPCFKVATMRINVS